MVQNKALTSRRHSEPLTYIHQCARCISVLVLFTMHMHGEYAHTHTHTKDLININ